MSNPESRMAVEITSQTGRNINRLKLNSRAAMKSVTDNLIPPAARFEASSLSTCGAKSFLLKVPTASTAMSGRSTVLKKGAEKIFCTCRITNNLRSDRRHSNKVNPEFEYFLFS